jgi:hypothetical protein
MNRTGGAALLVALLAALGSMAAQRPAASGTVVDVYKTPTCGCCSQWVEHLKQNGFQVKTTNLDDLTALKAKHRVPARAQSCHTALVGGYVVEGHVPASDVQRLLKEKPQVAGIAVAGMPIGSPGMEVPGVKPQFFQVMAFGKDGALKVFAEHGR